MILIFGITSLTPRVFGFGKKCCSPSQAIFLTKNLLTPKRKVKCRNMDQTSFTKRKKDKREKWDDLKPYGEGRWKKKLRQKRWSSGAEVRCAGARQRYLARDRYSLMRLMARREITSFTKNGQIRNTLHVKLMFCLSAKFRKLNQSYLKAQFRHNVFVTDIFISAQFFASRG